MKTTVQKSGFGYRGVCRVERIYLSGHFSLPEKKEPEAKDLLPKKEERLDGLRF